VAEYVCMHDLLIPTIKIVHCSSAISR